MIRDATLEETKEYNKDGYETWGAVLEEDGQITGRIYLSRAFGKVFGHNTVCTSLDPMSAAKLWFTARRKAREWGATEVFVHFEDDWSMLPFWEKLGFVRVATMYQGDIRCQRDR